MAVLAKPSCTLLFILTLSVIFIYTTIRSHLNYPIAAAATKNLYYRNAFLSSASKYTVAAYLHHLTLHPHLAGTPAAIHTALYVKAQFEAHGLETRFANYSTLLSYPKHSSLSAQFSNGTTIYLPLSEPNVPQNGVVMPYHAYSPSGTAYGKAVFLNYGREQDYRALSANGVEFKGYVGIVRRGCGLSRYEVVENAAAHGVAAVLMYTEGGTPSNNNNNDINNSFRWGVERGTVMKGFGDPLSPGWAGIDTSEKLDPSDPQVSRRFPTIPSLPVAEAVADSILSSLEGPVVPYEWRESLNGRLRRVGPGPTMLNFEYEGEQKMATIHNVFAVVRGSEEPDRIVLLGNHRDAWTYGAVDPNSGTAALLDIARRYARLLRLGWNPRRTIVLCSWDAEEFGMIGSTEWVEQNLVNLGSKSVAYLNVDCAVQGPGFFASTTPQLDNLLVEVTKKVKDPDLDNVILYEQWRSANKGINKIQRLSGVDSDFAPFLQHAGIPSIDLYYGSDFPVYHTAFDSYNWMTNFGDPSFQRHIAVTSVWGLLSLHLADDPVLPFNYLSYATELLEYKNVLNNLLEGRISLHPIDAAIQEFTAAANRTEEEAKKLRENENLDESSVLRKRMLNDRLMLAERGFLDSDGLQGSQWCKHLIYGPHSDTGSKLEFFPGIIDAFSRTMTLDKEERQAAIRHEIWRVARAIQRAACALKGAPNGTVNLLSTIDKSGAPTRGFATLPQYIDGYGSIFNKEEVVIRSEPETAQMTIIYAGQVFAFNDFPVDKANEIMMLATAQNHPTTVVSPPYMVPSPAKSTTNISVATPISNIVHGFDCLHYPQPSLGSATAQNHPTTAVPPPYMVPSLAESTTNISVATPISNIAHIFDCHHYPQPSLGSDLRSRKLEYSKHFVPTNKKQKYNWD
ncbi:putative glutamate carboxypeptidase 2 [Forsythia ovata]|uniref:glutamate carboxypeptidase II n=1 Tax=Forsythia ovata TaxID=205694 RepID=A0ABD1P3I2_9LAMI